MRGMPLLRYGCYRFASVQFFMWGRCGEFAEIKITNLLNLNKLVIA